MYSAGSVYLLYMTWHRICAYTSTNVSFSLTWLTLGWKASSFSRFCIYYCIPIGSCSISPPKQHLPGSVAHRVSATWWLSNNMFVPNGMLPGWVRGKDVFPQKKTGKHMISALIASCHFWNPILHPRLVSRVLNPPVLVAIMLMFSISAWTWKHRRWDGWYSKWHQVTIFGGINDGVNSSCMFPKTYQIDFLYFNTWMWCFA